MKAFIWCLLAVTLPLRLCTADELYKISAEDLKLTVRTYISQKVENGTGQVTITFMNVPEKVYVDKPFDTLTIHDTSKSVFRGTTVLFVRAMNENKIIKSIPVTLRLKILKNVLVSSNMVNRYAPLKPEDFHLEEVDITTITGEPFESFDDLTNLRAKRVISSGRVLLDSMVEQPPVIKRGDRVTILATVGAVTAATVGIAKADALTGETIRVKNDESGREIIARVKDARTVVVETTRR